MFLAFIFNPPWGRRSLAFGALGIGLLIFSSTARASDLTLQAIGGESGIWSSNPLLATSGARALYGSTTSPEFIVKNTDPTSPFSFDSRVDKNIFNQSAFNSTDAHETGSFALQNQRWSGSVLAHGDYDTTRTSELTTFGLNPIIARHMGLSVQPTVTYSSTAIDQLSLQGAVAASKYDNSIFTNYETFSASPTYTHHLDPRNAAIFTLQAQRYQTTRGNPVTVDSIGPSAGWQFIFSPRFTANASVGAQSSREYRFGFVNQPWTAQYTFAGGLAFQGLQDTIHATTSRAQYPYGDGTEALQTAFNITESHALTPLWAIDIGGNYLTSTYQISAPGNLKMQGGGNLGFTYHATEHIDFSASYQYRRETLIGDNRIPQDNALMLGLVLHPKLWTLLE